MHEQEIAAPETLSRDRSIGFRVDGKEDAGRSDRGVSATV